MRVARKPAGLVALLGCVLCLCGCTAKHYRGAADKDAYGAIAQKAPFVTNMEPRFTIEQTNALVLEGLPQVTTTNDFLGDAASAEFGARVLSLSEALRIAVRHSRSYQNSREQLYLTALSLTLSRHEFTPIFAAGGSGNYAVQTAQTVALVPDPVTGEPIEVLSDNLAEQQSVHVTGNVGVSWLIRGIGRLSAAFTTDFLRFLAGNPSTITSSQIGATLTRPLLRNAGYKADIENLTQAERDLLYQLREFVRFRKNFSVLIASAYYSVLGNRDAVRNSFLNLQSSRRTGDRTRALAAEGRTAQSDLGRIEQQELSAENAWVSAARVYQRALDDFKIQLGIPVETRIVLDDLELQELKIRHPDLQVEESIQIALAARLDYQNAHDELADSGRKVKLAADQFKPQLDLLATAGFVSPQEDHGFAVPDPDRYNWSAGANLDLPLERMAARNSYRAALIAEQRAARNLDQQRDQIQLQVRDSWRTLEQARRTYQISEIGVKLAERRVEEQELLAELGRAKALDQVDAQNDLVSSKDQLTQALVAHTIARLQFWDNMGILYIKDNGQWQEMEKPETGSTASDAAVSPAMSHPPASRDQQAPPPVPREASSSSAHTHESLSTAN
ncbi:MAG TPA: TolC family protein [Verrucomicrobiota bacterium]|nr:TolC family protein [Verrucomicrobiota bacterium]HQL77022.1 TolC family protein [Verrucomicrobiota bacterium]